LTSRHPSFPGTMTPGLRSARRVRTAVDRHPPIRENGSLDASGPDRVGERRSTWIGRVDSLAPASALPRAIARRDLPGRGPSLQSPAEGAQ
jgi:hypothetical protein